MQRRPPRRQPPARRKTIADQLREAVLNDGRTDGAIAEASGIDPAAFGRFMRAERSWTLTVADRVCASLGLELRPVVRQDQRTRRDRNQVKAPRHA
jgi:hypothetical protein